jgi:hypothetical protein
MKKIAILSLTLLAAGVGMSLPSTVRAEDQPTAPPSQNAAPKADHDRPERSTRPPLAKVFSVSRD